MSELQNIVTDIIKSAGLGETKVRGSQELAHWAKLFEQFNYSPQEFYRMVQKNLESRRIPGSGSELCLIREGGILSAERIYLSVRRQGLVFLLCAAPFGTGFFVSSRLINRRQDATWMDYLILGGGLFGVSLIADAKFGTLPALFTFGFLFTLIWSVFRSASTLDGDRLANMIADMPIVGPVFQSLFRPDTYYQRDTAEMFRQAMHNAVMEAVDQMTTEKGIRALTADERKAALRNLYQK